MSSRALAYICGVILAGAAMSVVALTGFMFDPGWPFLLLLVVLTTVAHLYISLGPSHDAWAVNLVFLFAGVILLPPFYFVILVLVPHLIEWVVDLGVKKSARLRNWYIQPFNISVHLIAGFAARGLYLGLTQDLTALFTPAVFLVVMLAAMTYVLVNHILIGLVLVLARRVTLRASGAFESGNLVSDFIQVSLGYVVAALWNYSPVLIIPTLAPLLLVYRALQVPKLTQEANTDAKTGLWNMRRFNEVFAVELERAKRFKRPLAVVMADLDLLRNVNNTYGHLAGDAVLVGIGKIIRESVREYDLPARFGGEEFSIVLLEANAEDARSFAERIRRTIESTEFITPTDHQRIHVTISLGVASFPADASTATELIQLADVAVYQAKLNGRNRVVCASDVPHSVKLESPSAEDCLSTAIPTADVSQPIRSGEDTSPAEIGMATPPADKVEEGPSKPKPVRARIWRALFIGAVVAIGTVITLWGLYLNPSPQPIALLLFVALAICTELFQVSLYGSSPVSVSVAFVFASGLVAGLPGVAATSAGVALTHYFQVRPRLYQSFFNWATHVVAGAVPALAVRALSLTAVITNLPVLVILVLVTGLIYYGIDTGLIAVAIALSEGQSIKSTWQLHFRWLIYHYLVLCLMGLFLAVADHELDWPGVIVFVLPIFMMHYAQQQYVERTEESVRELRRMNRELTRANAEVISVNDTIQKINNELFLVLAKIVDARDPFVSSHTTRVADYARAVAIELGLPVARVETIYRAALLHDIGKIATTEKILNKPTMLNAEEFATMMDHPLLGAEILDTSQSLRHLAPFVKHHHEWWNGGGYPDELRGEAIPLEARILAVCDAVEAMASDRPYSRSRSQAEIIAELQRCAGTQFDPQLVETFTRVIHRRGKGFVINSAREVTRQQSAHSRGLAGPGGQSGASKLGAFDTVKLGVDTT